MDVAAKREMVNRVEFWYHSIELGDGVVTPGQIPLSALNAEFSSMHVPDLAGKTVLDIGAWDGFYSFAAEKKGARRVLALDHYVWSLRLDRQRAYWQDCRDRQLVPSAYHLVPGCWEPGSLPGKSGFDTAHRILQSKVEQLVADYMTVEPVELGSFDVVFFRGVLYHLREPFEALRRLALLTRELAIIETLAIYVPNLESESLFEFYESNEVNADVGNWWAPNLAALAKCCRAAGFRHVEPVSGYPLTADRGGIEKLHRYRLTIHARH
jgi:tRNA (mo5U34)-methyltransferase